MYVSAMWPYDTYSKSVLKFYAEICFYAQYSLSAKRSTPDDNSVSPYSLSPVSSKRYFVFFVI